MGQGDGSVVPLSRANFVNQTAFCFRVLGDKRTVPLSRNVQQHISIRVTVKIDIAFDMLRVKCITLIDTLIPFPLRAQFSHIVQDI